jgi:hypothetical protein
MLEQPASAPHAATNSPNAPGVRIGVEDAIDDFNIWNPLSGGVPPFRHEGASQTQNRMKWRQV